MKTSTITLCAVGAIVAFIMMWWVFTGIGVRNQDASLRAQFSAVSQGNKVDFDAMWKIIKETNAVAENERGSFEKTYAGIVAAGSGNSGQGVQGLLLAIGVKPPQVDSALYRKVQDEIDAQRTKFANAQKQALDIKREEDKLRTTWPGSMFVGHLTPLEVKLVTSAKTEKAFETGKDDESLIEKK